MRSVSLAVVLSVVAVFEILAAPSSAGAAQLGVSLGSIDVFRDQDAVEVGLDVGFGPWRWGLVPNLGVHGTTDESFFGFVGLRRPFQTANGRWIVEPSFSIAGYDRGKGKELGGPLEFRSGLDLRRRLDGGTEIGLGVYHLSNSSLYDLNPGTNSLLLRIVFPDRSQRSP